MTIRLAFLYFDTPVPGVRARYGTYVDIFRTMLQSSLKQSLSPNLVFQLDGYDVAGKGELPSERKLNGYDGILLSGSAASAYSHLHWIPRLLQFISEVVWKHPHVKIFGECFGQQIVAEALGGKSAPNEEGWELGVNVVDLTAVGRLIFGRDKLRIQELHQDHVPNVPPNFKLLGSTDKCKVQGIVLPYSSARGGITSFDDIHVLCLQGHPEFTSDIMKKTINAWERLGVLNEEVATEGRRRAGLEHDGVNVIARSIWRLFGVSFA